MVNKLIVDGLNITLNESTPLPFTYTFSTAGTHNVRIGLDDTEEICAYAFKDCTELTKVTFPEKITMIKRNAFENCESLKSIDIPSTIRYVGPNVFDGCIKLSEINFEDTTPPTFLTNLSDDITCYIPDGSKFVLASELVKNGDVQYYEKNELGGYDEVDYEALEDGNEYYFDNWLGVHNHYNVVENRFKIRPVNIAFYDGDIENEVNTFRDVEQGTDTDLFDYKFIPENSTNRNVYWISNNPNLVSVDQNGHITAAKNVSGRATIYVCTEPYYDGSYVAASLTLRVVNQTGIQKTDPILNYSENNITITGEEYTLPELTNGNNVSLTYNSSNVNVATIDDNGNITLTGNNGSTVISAIFRGNDIYNPKTVNYTLTVSIMKDLSDEEFGFTQSNLEITSNEYELPELINTNNVDVTYESSNTDIVIVDEFGNITIKDNGIVIIKAIFTGNTEYNEKTVSYELSINIEEPIEEPTYTITFMNGDEIVKTVTGVTGTSVSAPDVTKEGYDFNGWSIDGINPILPVDAIYDSDMTYFALWFKTQEEGTIENEYDTDNQGNIQIINPNQEEGTIENEYDTDNQGNIQVINPDNEGEINAEYDSDSNGNVQVMNSDNE